VYFCTIASGDYLPSALIAVESLINHSGIDSAGVVLCSDDSEIPSALVRDDIEIVRLNAVLPAEEIVERRLVYSPFEFNTGLKAALLHWTYLHRQAQRAVYMDSDVIAVGDVTQLVCQHESVVLFPHIGEDAADHERVRQERDTLRFGAFNAGVVATRRSSETTKFLQWWDRRCRLFARVETAAGEYGDQRWLDLAPALFADLNARGIAGMNVGHWNLAECKRSTDGEVLHRGVPPALLHFSGVSLSSGDQGVFRWPPGADGWRLEWWAERAKEYREKVEVRRAMLADVRIVLGCSSLSPAIRSMAFERRDRGDQSFRSIALLQEAELQESVARLSSRGVALVRDLALLAPDLALAALRLGRNALRKRFWGRTTPFGVSGPIESSKS
jgi:hypothetical protein